MFDARGSVVFPLLAFATGLAMAAGNLVLLATLASPEALSLDLLVAAISARPGAAAFLGLFPLVAGGLFAAAGGALRTSIDEPAGAESGTSAPDAVTRGALRMLAILQQEGRLIDFLEEDIDIYSDEQVGAAARTVHTGCRRALRERLKLEHVLKEADGSEVEVPRGFHPSEIRLTGNVQGKPPFRGTLQHGGWRVVNHRLPEMYAGSEPTLLAPAEVEVQ